MTDFSKMSIQDRIRAMNQTIDKVEALPSQLQQFENSTNETVPLDEVESNVVDEQHSPSPPRRTSVVDMWRKREANASTSSEAPKPSPGPRKKSVLEKWSSAQQKQEAQHKQEEKVRHHEEEKKDQEPTSPPERMSVAEIIAQRSMLSQQVKSRPTPAMSTSKDSSVVKRASIADVIAQRAAPVNSGSLTTGDSPVETVPSAASNEEKDLVIIDANEPAGENLTPAKKSSVVAVWTKRGLTSDSAAATRQKSKSISASSQRMEAKEVKDEAPVHRKSVSDIWNKRNESSTVAAAYKLNTVPAAPPVSNDPSHEDDEANENQVPTHRRPVTDIWNKRNDVSSPMTTSKKTVAMVGKVKLSTMSFEASGGKSSSNADDKSSNIQSAREKRSESFSHGGKNSFLPQKSPVVGNAQPVWAKASLSSPSTRTDSTSPGETVDPKSQKPIWATKALKSTSPEASTPVSPSFSSKPAWAGAALRKTGLRVAAEPAEDEATVMSEPALSPSNKSADVELHASDINADVISVATEDPRESIAKRWQVGVNVRDSPKKRRNPNRSKIAIDLTSKDSVDNSYFPFAGSGTTPCSEQPLTKRWPPSTSSSKDAFDPFHIDEVPPKDKTSIEWPSSSDENIDPPDATEQVLVTSVQKQDVVRTPKSPNSTANTTNKLSVSDVWKRHDPTKDFASRNPQRTSVTSISGSKKPSASALVELAIKYRASPARTSSSSHVKPNEESARGQVMARLETKEDPTANRFSKRRIQLAQQHLHSRVSQSVSTTTSSDLESVDSKSKSGDEMGRTSPVSEATPVSELTSLTGNSSHNEYGSPRSETPSTASSHRKDHDRHYPQKRDSNLATTKVKPTLSYKYVGMPGGQSKLEDTSQNKDLTLQIHESSDSGGAGYIPSALSPRANNPTLPSRVRHKKELAQRQAKPSPVAASDAGQSDTSSWSFFSSSSAAQTSMSSVSELAERASKALHRRRGRQTAEQKPSVSSRETRDTAVGALAPFDEPPRIMGRPQSSRAEALNKHQQAVQGSSTGENRTAIDRSVFVNRYKSSDRFIDTGSGLESPRGVTPRNDEGRLRSFGSELSNTSSPLGYAASSEDGSDHYIKRASASVASDSTGAGPIKVGQGFRDVSSRQMDEMRSAYKSVTVSDFANDIRQEMATTLKSGGLTAMQSIQNLTSSLATGFGNKGPSKEYPHGVSKHPTLLGIDSSEEDVAIEVEYIGEDELFSKKDEFYGKAGVGPPAGQSSYKAASY